MTTNQTLDKTPSLSELARGAKPTRNRAIDFYRAVAMLAVAFGHWLAISLYVDDDGSLMGGNALADAPQFAGVSWLLQVMPLFFVVGGFASASSLDAHYRQPGATDADWLAARLRRLFAPVGVLAAFSLFMLLASTAAGVGGLGTMAAATGAIPLWFIANYTIDTAIAPRTLPAFRRDPVRFSLFLIGAIVGLEMLRFADFGLISQTLPHLNWILGWLAFQVAGFAWKDGLIGPSAAAVVLGAGFLGLATALVTFGPYPVSMVHFDGIGALSPTHPPSLALLAFGAGYSLLAIAVSPRINAMLERFPKVWTATVAANSVAMSVYLWHFTAAAIAGGVFYALGILPTAATGSAAWWVQKLPMIAASTAVLIPIVAGVSRVERRALLAPRADARFSYPVLVASAAVLSLAVKGAWTSQTGIGIAIGTATVLVIYRTLLHAPAPKS